MRFETAMLSNPGGRDHNEDFCDYFVGPEAACWVLADGLGGHGGGDVAAARAVGAIIEQFGRDPRVESDVLQACLQAANDRVVQEQQANPDLRGMRTTIVVLIADPVRALWAHVGDSRLYRFSGGAVAEQTEDHSVPQMMVTAGDIRPQEIRFHEDRNKLLRSLGASESFRPALRDCPLPLAAAEVFLLLSDGFWEHITETVMAAELAKSATPEEWLRRMESRVRIAAPGDFDNYSAIAVFVRGAGAPGAES